MKNNKKPHDHMRLTNINKVSKKVVENVYELLIIPVAEI